MLTDILPLAGVAIEEQRKMREERVREALRKGRVPGEVLPIVPSPRTFGYRARVSLRAGPDGRLGFHRPGSHDWIEAPLAEIARPEVAAEAARIEGRVRGESEVRSDGERVQVVREGRVYAGAPRLEVDGLRVSPRSFYQVNLEVNARIVDDVDRRLLELAPARVLDLFGGIGNLSARAARRGVPVTLVEQDRSSAADARVNLPGAEVVVADAVRLPAGKHFFDVAVLDPPRAGAPGVLERLLVTRPRAILYLSCEPATLARDLRPALAAGYRLEPVRPYDMFPGTEHVEALAVLLRP